ncbi:IS1634 family transposase [Pedobacter sp. SD-b]|uniref:IS1634 family transposase n=1 Tax=Pedobacter segetis TaxID=2793069 RepID=A0ABS1BNT3_9SPHI|nr:IS1634 family transposase [Pedobacter segetis]MBK0384553.1 IS1634 family transposase [Pedobacter segetis]
MFVRCKRNKSGSTSVQIIDKSSGRYTVYQTVGSSSDQQEIDYLIKKGKRIVENMGGQASIPFHRSKELDFIDTFLNSLDSMNLVGPELLLGRIFNDIGFNLIDEELFKHLVITRIVYPVSKLKTTDYLMKYKGIDVSVYTIYRYLDKLHKQQIDLVKEISFAHTLGILGGKLSIVFYDVTTLYFEASEEDDLRKTGFSKDGKHQHPQIVLGLLVSENGYPLDYDIFEGNKYEGETMMPIIEHFSAKYSFESLVVVADSGLLSRSNIQKLKDAGYQYILGARIKNMENRITEQILSLKLSDKESAELKMDGTDKLIIGYKRSRAIKDGNNRKRGLEKLEKAIQSGRLGKKNINNRGYNKYLTLNGQVEISINYDKYDEDSKWDGLKGYVTNGLLPKEEVIRQYSLLWNIERTFRISKSDLQIRPIFHRLRRRIESHICISFAACKVYKELERLLKEKKAVYSPEQTIDIIKTIYKVRIQTPYSENIYERLVIKNQDQQAIVDLFELDLN